MEKKEIEEKYRQLAIIVGHTVRIIVQDAIEMIELHKEGMKQHFPVEVPKPEAAETEGPGAA